MKLVESLFVENIETQHGEKRDFTVYYQLFGPPLGEAPIVLINHPLTGNSEVTGSQGWWKEIVGKEKVIDIEKYTVLALNIPGNGYPYNEFSSIVYTHLSLFDIAQVFIKSLEQLNIDHLYAIIGGSIGGALAWQIAALRPYLTEYLIPIATDYKATDWLLGICEVQRAILSNSKCAVEDARKHAMLCYRTPTSLHHKFNREKVKDSQEYQICSWLNYHGNSLKKRYQLQAYKLMNHLLSSIDISQGQNNFLEIAARISAKILMITIPSDGLFLADENWETYVNLKPIKPDITIKELKSIHGHDAFLLEYKQLEQLLKPIFKTEKNHETNSHHLVRNW